LSEGQELHGAAAEILADFDTGRVVVRFLHPVTGEMVMEVHLAPDVARDLAFTLTKASIAIEVDDAFRE
jgi:hypothetical protein